MINSFSKTQNILVNPNLSVELVQNIVKYLFREVVIFQHNIDDNRSFKMFTSQLCVIGLCKQVEISQVFGISRASMIRNVKKLKKHGPTAFYQIPKRNGKGGTVVTQEVQKRAEEFLLLGWTQQMVAEKLNINVSTLAKAIKQGRIHSHPKDSETPKKGRGSRETSSNLIGNANDIGKPTRKIYL